MKFQYINDIHLDIIPLYYNASTSKEEIDEYLEEFVKRIQILILILYLKYKNYLLILSIYFLQIPIE